MNKFAIVTFNLLPHKPLRTILGSAQSHISSQNSSGNTVSPMSPISMFKSFEPVLNQNLNYLHNRKGAQKY